MKRHLRAALFCCLMGAASWVNAQGNSGAAKNCSIQNISVEVVGTPTGTATTCNATVNLYFVAVLAGPEQKFLNLHIWDKSKYPSFNYLDQGAAPGADVLKDALGTVVLERKGGGRVWEIASVTGPGGVALPFNQDQLIAIEPPKDFFGLEQFFGNYVYFQVKNLALSAPVACTAITSDQILVDVWGSTTGNNKFVSCANTKVPLLQCTNENLPSLVGTTNCQVNPRSYSVSFNNTGNCRPYFIDYRIYMDANQNGVKDATDPQINNGDFDGDGIFDNVQVLIPNQGLTVTPLRPVQGLDQNILFIEGTFITLGAQGEERTPFTAEIDACEESSLPVSFKSFFAGRNQQAQNQVDLTWETAMEQNNKGFHVQRKTDGEWQTIAFVSSAAEGGNSTQTQRYTYKDNNNFRGVSQYRLLQEDLDGTTAYSDVKTVRGLEQAVTVVVYPNPAVNGKTSILFPDATTQRNVLISDLSGRAVKHYRNITDNSLEVDGLASGFYTVRVTDGKSGAVQVIKLVVQ